MRQSQSWLMTLADLTIILFIITAADLSRADARVTETAQSVAAIATAEPVAIFRPGHGSLAAWLAGQPADPRQQLTIIVRHAKGDQAASMGKGMALLEQAQQAGRYARMVVEEGEHSEIAAYLAYDASPAKVARDLHKADLHKAEADHAGAKAAASSQSEEMR